MRLMRGLSVAAVAGGLAVAATSVKAGELVTNGSFENTAQMTTPSGWAPFKGADSWIIKNWDNPTTGNGFLLNTDPANSHTGNNSVFHKSWGVFTTEIATAPADIAAGDLTLSFWTKGTGLGDGDFVQVSGVDTLPSDGTNLDGGVAGAVVLGKTQMVSSADWNQVTATIPAATTYKYYVVAISGSTPYYIDDVSLTAPTAAVPEPASLSLLGLGALAMLRRRRA